jgi:hypothetical protein
MLFFDRNDSIRPDEHPHRTRAMRTCAGLERTLTAINKQRRRGMNRPNVPAFQVPPRAVAEMQRSRKFVLATLTWPRPAGFNERCRGDGQARTRACRWGFRWNIEGWAGVFSDSVVVPSRGVRSRPDQRPLLKVSGYASITGTEGEANGEIRQRCCPDRQTERRRSCRPAPSRVATNQSAGTCGRPCCRPTGMFTIFQDKRALIG